MTCKIEKVKESKGYKIILENLNTYFKDNFDIMGIVCTSDPASLDFSIIVDFPKLKGVEIELGGNGPSQMYRIGGEGFIGFVISDTNGFSLMHTKKRGSSLYEILSYDDFRFGAPVDSPVNVREYFELFLEYYQQL